MSASLFEKFEGVENIDGAYGAKNIFFAWLYAISPVAFEKFVIEKEKIGDVYTPGIAEAITNFHHLVDYLPQVLVPLRVSYEDLADSNRAPAGLREAYLNYARDVYNYFRSPEDRKWSEEMMKYVTVVITDGGRILGIGDQGFNGSWIAAGKQRCYFLGSGGAMLPQFAVPVGVDVGTDREKLREDPAYQGSRIKRLRGKQYYDFMHFVLQSLDGTGVGIIQFEDFEGEKAWNLLNWARENLKAAVFNDDIEGTGAMAMEGFLAAERLHEINLANSLFFFCGAGGAASGIKQQLEWYLKMKGAELDNFFFTDSRGALYRDRKVKVAEGTRTEFNKFQEGSGMVLTGTPRKKLKKYMGKQGKLEFGEVSFEDLIACFGDELGEDGSIFLIGTATVPGGISPQVINLAREAIDKKNPDKKLVIFGLSNPTEKTDFLTLEESRAFLEATNEKQRKKVLQKVIQRIYEACQGKVLLATGSPWGFFPLEKGKELIVSQGNNILIFPAVGLALRLVGARKVRQDAWQNIWMTASEALYQWFAQNESEKAEKGALFPTVEQVQEISEFVALAVARKLLEDKRLKIEHLIESYCQVLDYNYEAVVDRLKDLIRYSRGELEPSLKLVKDFRHLAGGRLKRTVPEYLVTKVKGGVLTALHFLSWPGTQSRMS